MIYNEIQGKLHAILQNCQYLSLIDHIKQAQIQGTQSSLQQKQLSPFYIARLIVQMSYLMFTCSIMKTDIYLSSNPLFCKRFKNATFQPRLVFFLSDQQYQKKNLNKQIEKKLQFKLLKYQKFNQNVLSQIVGLIQKVENLLSQQNSQNLLLKQSINKLFQYIKRFLQPRVIEKPNYNILKYLEETELFLKYSDLQLGLRCSLFYQIKNKQQILNIIRKSIQVMRNRMIDPLESKNYQYIYKQLDLFFMQLADKHVISLQKTSTKGIDGYIAGDVFKYNENGRNFEKYVAKILYCRSSQRNLQIFQNLQQKQFIKQQKINEQQFLKWESNIYTIQYSVDNSLICIRNMTLFQANTQSIDILSAYCSNIAFNDINVTIQNVDYMKNNSKLTIPKRYLNFKSIYQLDLAEQPFIKILTLIQFLSICTRLYIQLLCQKPSYDTIIVPQLFYKRLNHLLRLFVDRANCFYSYL